MLWRAYFAQEEGGAQVLICSEIGSTGRNFQFANQLVMFDLPFEPLTCSSSVSVVWIVSVNGDMIFMFLI
ncbi:hypothetical protein OH492_22570 [Vibrio chagasii]|nr:hypothetical protein [Vibrio chagasii]